MFKHWHVIQVIGGQETKVVEKIQSKSFHAFIPKRVRILRKQGKIERIEEPLFPGYVFIETDKEYTHFRLHLEKHIRPVKGVIRLLKHDNEGLETILPHERMFIERFTDTDKLVQPSIGFIEGDRIVVTSGPLMGQESLIRKINRHKRTAELEISMFGREQSVSVSLEIITKTS